MSGKSNGFEIREGSSALNTTPKNIKIGSSAMGGAIIP
jgi:hypothetical protein